MIRRQFIRMATLAGASSLTALASAKNGETRTVIYHVKGFSCVTCAVGLDTILGQHEGVVRSKSTYPEGIATVTFDPARITEASIKSVIAEMGFTVTE
jgi:copper chaperone CopZ